MSFTTQQLDEIKVYLGTMHYLSKKARRSGLYFIEQVMAQAIVTIEDSLKKGKHPQAVELIIDSDFIQLMRFTDLLSKASDDTLAAFLEEAEKEGEQVSELKTGTSFP